MPKLRGQLEMRASLKSRNLEWTNIHTGSLKNNGPLLALKRRLEAFLNGAVRSSGEKL
jgi:hypothetical protein